MLHKPILWVCHCQLRLLLTLVSAAMMTPHRKHELWSRMCTCTTAKVQCIKGTTVTDPPLPSPPHHDWKKNLVFSPACMPVKHAFSMEIFLMWEWGRIQKLWCGYGLHPNHAIPSCFESWLGRTLRIQHTTQYRTHSCWLSLRTSSSRLWHGATPTWEDWVAASATDTPTTLTASLKNKQVKDYANTCITYTISNSIGEKVASCDMTAFLHYMYLLP